MKLLLFRLALSFMFTSSGRLFIISSIRTVDWDFSGVLLLDEMCLLTAVPLGTLHGMGQLGTAQPKLGY